MHTEVIVFCPVRNVSAAVQQIQERRGNKPYIVYRIHNGRRFSADFSGNGNFQILHGGTVVQCADGSVHAERVGKRADVGDFHTFLRDDELPAGGDGIICGVFRCIPQTDQRRDHHVVIGILWEAQPYSCQLRSFFIYGQRRVSVHPQVDLGVDQLQFSADLQTHFGQIVPDRSAVGESAAQHHALAVVPLLDPGVHITVNVEGQEKILQQLSGFVRGQDARVQILPQVGHQIYVKPADRVVVIAFHPQTVMDDPEELEGFTESCGRVFGYSGEHVCHICSAGTDGFLPVAFTQRGKGIQIGNGQRIRPFSGGSEAGTDKRHMIRTDVGYVAGFMDEVLLTDTFPFFGGQNIRAVRQCPHEHDLLPRQDVGIFRFLRCHFTEPGAHPLCRSQSGRGIFGGTGRDGGTTPHMMGMGDYEVI